MSEQYHIPVLLEACLEGLQVQAGGRYCDCTVGGAGHAQAILSKSDPDGQLLALDRDPEALDRAQHKLATFGDRVHLLHRNFAEISDAFREIGWQRAHGIMADLGVSSRQLDKAERGFSFRQDGPIDMRMDPTRGQSALDLIHALNERELADVIFRYGEERRSRPIARAIKAAADEGQLSSTLDLAKVVHGILGPRRRGKIDPATRTFQGLRIAVNGELDAVEDLLADALDLLEPGGRLAIITFHSLEDRIVKQRFRTWAFPQANRDPAELDQDPPPARIRLITRRPIVADEIEQKANPRARSAKLRIAEKLA